MKVQTVTFLCVLAFALAAPASHAGGLYLTGKVGTTSVDADLGGSIDQILDGDDESAALGLGLSLGDHLAFEFAYHDFGTVPSAGSTCTECFILVAPLEGDTTAYSLSFLPHLPISDNFSAYGKIGVMSWETSLSEVFPQIENTLEDDYSDEDIVYGIGLRFLLPGPFGVFAEFERFGDSFESVSMGATLGF
jgi:hypothetical protein